MPQKMQTAEELRRKKPEQVVAYMQDDPADQDQPLVTFLSPNMTLMVPITQGDSRVLPNGRVDESRPALITFNRGTYSTTNPREIKFLRESALYKGKLHADFNGSIYTRDDNGKIKPKIIRVFVEDDSRENEERKRKAAADQVVADKLRDERPELFTDGQIDMAKLSAIVNEDPTEDDSD